jgi:hypothetical protein
MTNAPADLYRYVLEVCDFQELAGLAIPQQQAG